jgi:hypothetical protein
MTTRAFGGMGDGRLPTCCTAFGQPGHGPGCLCAAGEYEFRVLGDGRYSMRFPRRLNLSSPAIPGLRRFRIPAGPIPLSPSPGEEGAP